MKQLFTRNVWKKTTRRNFSSKRGKLVLENGKTFEGVSIGSSKSSRGEIVFSTNLVGYPESFTDPSYCGQILTLTYPMVGNYGCPSYDLDNYGLHKYLESKKIWLNGLVVQHHCNDNDHWSSSFGLSEWLKKENIPALSGIDVREVTKNIRNTGFIKGEIIVDNNPCLNGISFEQNIPVACVSSKEVKNFNCGKDNAPHIIAVDCGIKNNTIRCLLERGCDVTVVPFDYNFNEIPFDGLFLSNGPGDPRQCNKTIRNVQIALQGDIPIFGICMGNQLLALAAGIETTKMKFGNRAHNTPVMDKTTGRVFMSSQNHGFMVDNASLEKQPEWDTYFENIHDGSNEGIIHKYKPFFGAQFHPEVCGGPDDTSYLFDKFVSSCQNFSMPEPVIPFIPSIPKKEQGFKPPKKIIVLGSGGLQIGQAGEFDYSGSQAIKAYKEEGIETILVNPNIATIQTDKGLADKVYSLPVTPDTVKDLIIKEKPDAISLSFGGQTALNCGVELYQNGTLDEHSVSVLGTSVESIISTEDRDIFCEKMAEIGEPVPKSIAVTTVDAALKAAESLCYPVIGRVAYALGGLGSGFCKDPEELEKLVSKALTVSPQILIEQDLRGWKEIEYEVVRDMDDNCVAVCNMENFDPLGTHTADSIVIAPSQTLNDDEYQMLRNSSIAIARHLGIVGECNVQFGLHPTTKEYVCIESNPRLSRSSALASKATGYPLAAVAAKIGLGKSLHEIKNTVNNETTSAFEPALDYCVVKHPRWDLDKFQNVSKHIGSAMKSVGEVMSIGRTFEEALQKAIRMVDDSRPGFEPGLYKNSQTIETEMQNPTDMRLYAIADAFYSGNYSIDEIHELSKIDKWFLRRLQKIVDVGNDISKDTVDTLHRAKKYGFSDIQIGKRLNISEMEVRKKRQKEGIIPVVKQIDTLAAEFPAKTNYLYTTYNATYDDVEFDDKGTMVLGCGTYRIGSSVEFDYCSVQCARELKRNGYSTIIVNNNPETVSTDFDESDRLYFEELSFERVLDIYEKENANSAIVSFGGQLPNNIALELSKNGVHVLGTNTASIDSCEDRDKYSSLLDSLEINQPVWETITSFEDAREFCEKIGYPVLLRPSYVLSGAAMNIVRSDSELKHALSEAANVSNDYPVVMTQFIEDAIEIDVDAVAKNGEVIAIAVSEHIERAGVHSGDATLVLPTQNISPTVREVLIENTKNISSALNINGPFNSQFLLKDNWIGVIETNMRASRSVPFVSKVLDVDFVKIATQIMTGEKLSFYPKEISIDNKITKVGVKSPQFSFQRLKQADPILTCEMSSTGEVAAIHEDFHTAFLQSLESSCFKIPPSGSNILISIRNDETDIIDTCRSFTKFGYNLITFDEKSEQILKDNNIKSSTNNSPSSLIESLSVQMTVDLSNNSSSNYSIRRESIDFSVPLITNAQIANTLSRALLKKYSNKDKFIQTQQGINDEDDV